MLSRLLVELFRLIRPRSTSLKAHAEDARDRGDWEGAATAYRNYLLQMPHDAAAHNDVGIVYCELCQFDAAQASFEKAAEYAPKLVAAHLNLGHLALQQKRGYREAVSHYSRALDLDPSQSDARRQISLAYYELGEVGNALRYLEPLQGQSADSVNGEYSLFMRNALPDLDRDEHFAAHLCWATRIEAGVAEKTVIHRLRGNDSNRRIRVAYVSADFREHAVIRFLLPLIEHHCRSDFEIYCYANQSEDDAVTQEIRRMHIVWRNVLAIGDKQLSEMIVADQIDILVDLSGHTRGNRLGVFALRPALVQLTWLGYLNTTGLKVMDYRITDSSMDPPGVSERFHSEILLRLDPTSWCYRAHVDVPSIKSSPLESNGYVTFGSFNHVAKLNEKVLDCWSQILAACPRSRLKLVGVPADDASVRRLLEPFRRRGIAEQRLHFFGRLQRKDYLIEMTDTDIALDPFPYCGGATTCESLWMGLPVIALAGDFGFSRSSSAIITQAGLEGSVADSVAEYVEMALAFAQDGVGTLRNSMRERLRSSELMNEQGFVLRLESAYRQLYRTQ